MSSVTALRPRAALRRLPPRSMLPGPDGLFWCPAVGSALGIMAELAPHLDTLSASIGHLPERITSTRPAVGDYLGAVKTLATSWHARTRPALQQLAAALAAVAASVSHGAERKGAASTTLVRRMASAILQLEKLTGEFQDGLGRMAQASGALDSDTVSLSERLQADQVHALLLSQQASTLQAKLDDATMRQHAYWLLGPHAEQIRQEIAMHNSAREGVRRQLDHLRAEQAALQCEARYLQQLLPSLGSYLAGLDRFGASLRAALGASRALLGQWRALHAEPDEAPGQAAACELAAAAPHWEGLAASLASLRKPAGCRT
jgi:chromosome segregation ATPase